MRRTGASVNYAAGSLTGNLFNIYLHGTAIISAIHLVFGLATAGDLATAINAVIDFYIMRLVPWPLDEILLAETLADLLITHTITVTIGLLSASIRYWLNNPNY